MTQPQPPPSSAAARLSRAIVGRQGRHLAKMLRDAANHILQHFTVDSSFSA